MLDGSAAAEHMRGLSDEELAPHAAAAWPMAWVLLQPSRKGPRCQCPSRPLAVPLRIDQVLYSWSTLA